MAQSGKFQIACLEDALTSLFFIIFVNDLWSVSKLFVDDRKIYQTLTESTLDLDRLKKQSLIFFRSGQMIDN